MRSQGKCGIQLPSALLGVRQKLSRGSVSDRGLLKGGKNNLPPITHRTINLTFPTVSFRQQCCCVSNMSQILCSVLFARQQSNFQGTSNTFLLPAVLRRKPQRVLERRFNFCFQCMHVIRWGFFSFCLFFAMEVHFAFPVDKQNHCKAIIKIAFSINKLA